MYVSGNLNNWIFDKNNLMTYNSERGEYECTMLLKQGWYNYEYVFLKDGGKWGPPNSATRSYTHFYTPGSALGHSPSWSIFHHFGRGKSRRHAKKKTCAIVHHCV